MIPEVNGLLAKYRESREFMVNKREYFDAACKAVMNKILEHERVTQALALDSRPRCPVATRLT